MQKLLISLAICLLNMCGGVAGQSTSQQMVKMTGATQTVSKTEDLLEPEDEFETDAAQTYLEVQSRRLWPRFDGNDCVKQARAHQSQCIPCKKTLPDGTKVNRFHGNCKRDATVLASQLFTPWHFCNHDGSCKQGRLPKFRGHRCWSFNNGDFHPFNGPAGVCAKEWWRSRHIPTVAYARANMAHGWQNKADFAIAYQWSMQQRKAWGERPETVMTCEKFCQGQVSCGELGYCSCGVECQAPKGINSGDIVFLKIRSGSGNHIDVEGIAVRSRWQSQGNFQALTIEKENGGTVRSGDVVYLKAYTGAYLDVTDGVVQARWADTGAWQELVIKKRSGSGAILPNDIVCFQAHTGKHLDIANDVVRARWNDCGDWQAMRIEKEVVGALFSGDPISLLAHTGNRIEVEGTSVAARWNESGAWQTFTIENYGGRGIFSGDAVFLKAHTAALLHVQDTAVAAQWHDYGEWQTFYIERKTGEGPVMPGDSIFLRSYTGRFIEVEGQAVQCRWFEAETWQTLIVEKSAVQTRRLTDASQNYEGREQEQHRELFVL